MTIETRIAGGASATTPSRLGAAFILATVVTLAAAIPLGVLAWQGRDNGPVESRGLVVSSAGAIAELSGFVLEPGNSAEIFLDDPEIVAAAWSLYVADGELLFAGEAAGAPPLAISLRPDALATMQPGLYDLLVSGTERNGNSVERAARFKVGGS